MSQVLTYALKPDQRRADMQLVEENDEKIYLYKCNKRVAAFPHNVAPMPVWLVAEKYKEK